MYQLCRHIKSNGLRCESPALRGAQFCYYHSKARALCAEPNPRYGPLQLPVPEDAASVQLSVARINDALINGRLDLKKANALFYGLQIAAQFIDRKKFFYAPNAIRSTEQTDGGDELAPDKYHCEDGDECEDCPFSRVCPNCTEYEGDKDEDCDEEEDSDDGEEDDDEDTDEDGEDEEEEDDEDDGEDGDEEDDSDEEDEDGEDSSGDDGEDENEEDAGPPGKPAKAAKKKPVKKQDVDDDDDEVITLAKAVLAATRLR